MTENIFTEAGKCCTHSRGPCTLYGLDEAVCSHRKINKYPFTENAPVADVTYFLRINQDLKC